MVLGTEAGIRDAVQVLSASYNLLSNNARPKYIRLTPFVIFHALGFFSVLFIGCRWSRSDGMGELLSNASGGFFRYRAEFGRSVQ